MSSDSSPFQNIDNGLKRYYESLGRTDYLNDDGIGKFIELVQVNDFQEDEIEDELGGDVEDCMYLEFDDNFPIPPDQQINENDANQRQQFMFDIIKKCHNNTNITFKNYNIPQNKEQNKQQNKDQTSKPNIDDNKDNHHSKQQKEEKEETKEFMVYLGNEPMIKKTCDAINRYYKSLNKPYNKLFSHYCYDNNYNDDTIKEEMSESQLIEFDTITNFPFDEELQKITKKEEKEKFMFDLIRICYNDSNINFNRGIPHCLLSKSTMKYLFEMKSSYLVHIANVYKKQCPVLWNDGLDRDRTFLYILAVGRRHNFDYLQHFVDNFFRERIKNINSSYTEKTYIEKSKYVKSIKDIRIDTDMINAAFSAENVDINNKKYDGKHIEPKAGELTLTALRLFNKRCCAKFMFQNLERINDSLEITVRYIDAAIGFIKALLVQSESTNTATCPFQFDFSIGYDDTTTQLKMEKMIENNDDDDDTDDDDKKEEEKKTEIGDIEAKLISNRLNYEILHLFASFNNDDEYVTARNFRVLMEKFKEEYNLDIASNDKQQYYYPQNRRFVIFVDRRKEGKKKKNEKKAIISMPPDTNESLLKNSIADKMYLYEAPRNCRIIPKQAVPEWYISSTKTSLLPNMEYGDGKEAEHASSNNKEKQNGNIRSTTHCNGKVLTLSFHVREDNVIKCYLYWMGQMIRFKPNDIKTVLPKIFNMKWNNNIPLKKIGIEMEKKKIIQYINTGKRDKNGKEIFNEKTIYEDIPIYEESENEKFLNYKENKQPNKENMNTLIDRMDQVIIDSKFDSFQTWCDK